MCENHADSRGGEAADGARRLPPWVRVVNAPFIAGIWVYRMTLSPLVGRYCRFSPTCSQYGLEAYRSFGPWRATCLTAWRLARCQPFARGGYDPVPLVGSMSGPDSRTGAGKAPGSGGKDGDRVDDSAGMD